MNKELIEKYAEAERLITFEWIIRSVIIDIIISDWVLVKERVERFKLREAKNEPGR